MNYQIFPDEETVWVRISEAGESDMLDMLEEPQEISILAESSRKAVLGEINLEKLLVNLDNCVDLLQITYCAVGSLKERLTVHELSNRFMNAITKSGDAAQDFKVGIKRVIDAYLETYQGLINGQPQAAVLLLADTSNVAIGMVKKTDELVKTFDELTAYTNETLQEVVDGRSVDETKRNEMKALITDMEGAVKIVEQLKESFQKDIVQYETDYKELQQREMVQENQAYNMQIASMVLGAVSGIFGANSTGENTKEERNHADPLAKRRDAMSVKRDLLQEKEHENLVNLAEYTAKMKTMVMDGNSQESVIQSLALTVGCLRRVLECLHEIRRFWERVETLCGSRADANKLRTMIDSHQEAEPEYNAVYFKTILFVRGYAEMRANWKALEVIFSQYPVALANCSKKVTAILEDSLLADHTERWKLAAGLAGELNARLEQEILQQEEI